MKKTDCKNKESLQLLNKHSNLYKPHSLKRKILDNVIVVGLISLVWFVFRTGKKPTRVVYPCQQIAVQNISEGFLSFIPLISLSVIWLKIRNWFSYTKVIIVILLTLSTIGGSVLIRTAMSAQEVSLQLEPYLSDAPVPSDIFVVNGPEVAHISDLVDLMGSEDLLFYLSATEDINQGAAGLIASDDVVLIKNNCQWSQRGGTNTDIISELVEAIIAHPDGFTGEIVIADNGQGRGSMDWSDTNSEDKKLSVQDVANQFSSTYDVSAYLWDDIRNNEVDDYSLGNMEDGYIVYDTPDPETGIYTSYPKFETDYGTKLSFKNGIWNGTAFEQKLKIINLPVLKTHSSFGVTATLKHYMGVQSQGVANGHDTIKHGSMGTLLVDLGLPTLNIIDAIWVNANPEFSGAEGPGTSYSEATKVNVLIAGLDPVALDYWSANNVLLQTSKQIGYTDPFSIDPTSTDGSGLTEAFGIWLNKTHEELTRGGYNLTSNELEMNIYINNSTIDIETGLTTTAPGFQFIILGVGLVFAVYVFRRKRKK